LLPLLLARAGTITAKRSLFGVDGFSASRMEKKNVWLQLRMTGRHMFLALEQETAHAHQLSTHTTVHTQEHRHCHNETIPMELFPPCKPLHAACVVTRSPSRCNVCRTLPILGSHTWHPGEFCHHESRHPSSALDPQEKDDTGE
jgi:hypothetical protein